MYCVVLNNFSKRLCDVDAFAAKYFFAWPFFCIRVIVFSCENKGLKKGYMPVAPFVNFKEMEAYFFSSLCDAQSQSKKFFEHEIVLKMLNISTESSFIILLD